MKRQFVQIQPSKTLPDAPQESASYGDVLLPGDIHEPMQGDLAPLSLNGTIPPPFDEHKRKGLLTSGKYVPSTHAAGNALPNTGPNSIVDQATVLQPVVKAPITGPLVGHTPPSSQLPPLPQGFQQAQRQPDYYNAPASAYQSSMAPLNAPNAPYMGMPGTALQQPPISQSLPPMSVPNGFNGVSGAWQPMPGNFNRAFTQPPIAMPPVQAPASGKKRKKKLPLVARVAIAACIVLLLAVGGGLGYYQIYFANHLSNITGQQAANITITNKDGSTQSSSTAGNVSIGSQRINILLLGSDTDSKFSSPIAQTDIIVTIDPTTKYVGMLSIPRDLWLNVPGFGMHKLDEAFGEGWSNVHQSSQPFANAVGMSILTIEQDFGIHIDHYAWVGLDGFIKVIDTAGGVDVDAIHPMVDDTYPNDINSANPYSYKRLYVPPGPQHMNGIQALEYVRTRHSDLVGDFGRSARQQQILSQLKTKLVTPGIINQLPQLAQDLDGYVKTDMDLPTLVNLMTYARGLDPNKIDHLVLSPPYSKSFTTPSGADAFEPICSQIQPAIAKMFNLGSNALCNVTADSGNGIHLAASTPSSASSAVAQSINTGNTTNPFQGLSQMTQVGAMSINNGNTDMFGVHSILDLMFLVVFESFDATKV